MVTAPVRMQFNREKIQCKQKQIFYAFKSIPGAASINYHILSTESRKYFRNAILMSGSVGNPWAIPSQHDHVKMAFEIAEKLDTPQKSYDELITFLKTTSAASLNQFSTINILNAVQFSIVFGPTIESN